MIIHHLFCTQALSLYTSVTLSNFTITNFFFLSENREIFHDIFPLLLYFFSGHIYGCYWNLQCLVVLHRLVNRCSCWGFQSHSVLPQPFGIKVQIYCWRNNIVVHLFLVGMKASWLGRLCFHKPSTVLIVVTLRP